MTNSLYQAAKVLSIVLFLYYGLAVLFSNAMVTEFERYGLLRFRKLTGSLEVLGALGLLLGYLLPPLVLLASGGLTLLMIGGVVVRLKSGDSLVDSLPATVMGLINAFIFLYATGLVAG
jgi:hypothetical protein